jgi:site-specific recombinase XerD
MIKVFLREKKLLHNKRGLYLDFYPAIVKEETGRQTRREHLGLYIYEKPKGEGEREHNKETRMLAEAIRSRRQLELQAGAFGFVPHRIKQKDFLEYFHTIVEAKRKTTSKSNHDTWKSVSKYLVGFAGDKITFGQINEAFCENFKDYLLQESSLSQNSAAQYFDKFKAAVREAADKRRLPTNPAAKVRSIKVEDSQREFLTMEELVSLSQTDFRHNDLKQASLFSAMTGLRYSDIAKLTWGEVHQSRDGYSIRFRQKKTRSLETLPISEEATELLGIPSRSEDLIFKDLQYWQCSFLQGWVTAAGIQKRITFHCFRHTYATLQLTFGTDIYTLSKLLGHKSLHTTQIYGHIVNERKRAAADLIKLKQ